MQKSYNFYWMHGTDSTDVTDALLAYKNTNFATFGFVLQTLYVPHTQSVSIAEFAGPVVVEEVDEYVAVEHVVMDIIKDSPMIFFFYSVNEYWNSFSHIVVCSSDSNHMIGKHFLGTVWSVYSVTRGVDIPFPHLPASPVKIQTLSKSILHHPNLLNCVVVLKYIFECFIVN